MSTPMISTTTNEWRQNQMLTNKVVITMENPAGDHHSFKCPRCNSCNTKFCYYNNYSLSQPRHFCKACKRYWTRGGTLRNVPVGGGCRKNKRAVKRAPPPPPNVGDSSHADHTDLTSRHPFYTDPLELNFPFSEINTGRVTSRTTGFSRQSQMINGVGMRFSSGLIIGENCENGFKRQIENVIASDSINPVLFGSSTKSGPRLGEFQGLMRYEGMEVPGEDGGGNGFGLNPAQFEQINASDNSSLLWTTTAAWFDPSDMGSSVPSLI